MVVVCCLLFVVCCLKITMLLRGKSTISTGPFSSSQTARLPEGKVH